ncbi:MAG: hypothetical protein QW743_08340 [Candidatus Methanomethylicia archaeon]
MMMDEKPVYYGEDAGYYNFEINILIRVNEGNTKFGERWRLVINLIRK